MRYNTFFLLLRSYFSKKGIEYNIARIPIRSTDFSTRPYSYDDFPNDIKLQNFSLTDEDYKYKVLYGFCLITNAAFLRYEFWSDLPTYGLHHGLPLPLFQIMLRIQRYSIYSNNLSKVVCCIPLLTKFPDS